MSRDIVDEIITDHREVEDLFGQIEDTGNPRIQQVLVQLVIAELMRHSAAEEQFLYPTARTALPDGDEVAERELAEHASAEELMQGLEKALDDGWCGTARFNAMVHTLMEEIRHHFSEEEAVLLPRLRGACDPGELAQLGRQFGRTRNVAPARPANQTACPGMGLIDRMREALTGRQA